jgi:hypothetical protein
LNGWAGGIMSLPVATTAEISTVTAAKALAHFGQRLSLDASLRKKITTLQEQLPNDKT